MSTKTSSKVIGDRFAAAGCVGAAAAFVGLLWLMGPAQVEPDATVEVVQHP